MTQPQDPLKLSYFDRVSVGEILGGEGDWFSAQLLRLIAKADKTQRERLRSIYPEHVEAYEKWKDGKPQ